MRKTLNRYQCRRCGNVATVLVTPKGFRCTKCGAKVDRADTYKPVTGGMTEAQKRERKREQQQAYYQRHKKERNTASADWRRMNPDKARATTKRCNDKRRDKIEAYNASEAGKTAKKAYEERIRERFKRTGEVPNGVHGTSAAYRAGCRCDRCKAWRYNSHCQTMSKKLERKANDGH